MGRFTEGDRVGNSHPIKCEGIRVRPKAFKPKELTHEESVEAVMLVYVSGDTEIECPICGRY